MKCYSASDAMPFSFDPNLATAETLPARLYTDPAVLPLEKRRAFERSWQLVGRVDQVRRTGDFFTAEVGDEPIVVVRDGDDLRAFHNVCQHRGGPVAQGCGSRKSLQCRYHGWTYALSGRLQRAPEMEGVERFAPDEVRLRPVAVDRWGPLVFVNVDVNAPPLASFLDDLPARVAGLGIEAMTHVMRRDYVIACNWKIYVDNYLEGYHIPVVHPGLFREIDYDRYRVETRRYSSHQHAPLRAAPARGAGDEARRYVTATATEAEGDDAQAHYFWLFPNLMLNIYLGQMQTNVIVPLSHDRTLTIFEWYATHPPSTAESRARWDDLAKFSDEIQAEDIAICEAVQKNLRSRAYERGRYSVKRENGLHHFHGLLHEFLSTERA